MSAVLRPTIRPSWCVECRDEVVDHFVPDGSAFHLLPIAEGPWGKVVIEQWDSPAYDAPGEPFVRLDPALPGGRIHPEWTLEVAREVVEALSAAVENLESIVSSAATR